MVGGDGLTAAVKKEADAALNAHGLIKIRVFSDDRAAREAMFQTLADELNAAPIQHIGKLLVLWRPMPEREKVVDENRMPGPRDFKVLKETRMEYWGLQIINFLDCTIFFALLNIASVFLSDDFGFSDKGAGWIITIFTSGTTLCLFFSGLLLLEAPYSNSLTVMAEITIADGLNCFTFRRTSGGRFLMMKIQMFVSSMKIITTPSYLPGKAGFFALPCNHP